MAYTQKSSLLKFANGDMSVILLPNNSSFSSLLNSANGDMSPIFSCINFNLVIFLFIEFNSNELILSLLDEITNYLGVGVYVIKTHPITENEFLVHRIKI